MTTTRARPPQNGTTSFEAPSGSTGSDFDMLSDAELEALLFQDDARPKSGLWNLPTLTGLSLVAVGALYLLQQFELWAGDLSALVAVLPVFAGIFIVLLGMGVLSWRPKKRTKKRRAKKTKRRVADALSGLTGSYSKASHTETPSGKEKTKKKKRLRKSKRNKKLMGVCGGLGEYLNLDPTFVRIAFIIGLLVTNGAFFFGYFLLAYALPDAETMSAEERLRIIRES